MGFSKVYRCLQELFPQIDARLLKAVAIEHSKDVDAAVEAIVTEVLPFVTEKAKVSHSNIPIRNLSSSGRSDGEGGGGSSCEVELEEEISLSRRRNVGSRPCHERSQEGKSVTKENVDDSIHAGSSVGIGSSTFVEEAPFYDATDGHDQLSEIFDGEAVKISQNALEVCDTREDQTIEVQEIPTLHPNGVKDHSKLCGNSEGEELILLRMRRTPERSSCCSNSSTSCIMPGTTSKAAANSLCDLQFSGTVDSDAIANGKSHDEEPDLNGPSAEADNLIIHFVPSALHELTVKTPLSSQELETVAFMANNSDVEVIEVSGDCIANTGVQDVEATMVASACGNNGCDSAHEDDGSLLEMTAIRSEQICSVDLLEQIIDDAKDNKKTLFSAMESVINMMREVEDRERAAELAKEEAEMGGVDLFTKVMELKEMLVHAKEANDMHAGEVYGEKAVLATEVRELQSRLRCLSDERDKALAILDEMTKIMESRIAEAEEVRIAAEKEKLNREKLARAALAEQEAIMEKVVQESKVLQEAADENSKLREFLMDRGHVVDILQGEISVICQDVRLLKEKFDARVPLSQSVSSSQTSCLLASSSSSRRSLSNSLILDDGAAIEVPGKSIEPMSLGGTVSVVPPKANFEEERGGADMDLADMGWEFFDKDTELNGAVGGD